MEPGRSMSAALLLLRLRGGNAFHARIAHMAVALCQYLRSFRDIGRTPEARASFYAGTHLYSVKRRGAKCKQDSVTEWLR